MATTVSLTKINFMSKDTFNKLSSLDSRQLYAVEASSLITSVMNSAGNKRLTKLFDKDIGTGDITLNKPFTDYDKLIIYYSDDSFTFEGMFQWDTKVLDYYMSLRNIKGINLLYANTFWKIKSYANGSSKTLFKLDVENCSIIEVLGMNYVA